VRPAAARGGSLLRLPVLAGALDVAYISARAIHANTELPARRPVHPGPPWPLPMNSTLPSIPSSANTCGTSLRPPEDYPRRPLPFPRLEAHRSKASSGDRRWPPVRPLAGCSSPTTKPTNRTLVGPRPLPCSPRPDSGESSPEFPPDRRCPSPRTQLRGANSF
jgi:hypothetical protein